MPLWADPAWTKIRPDSPWMNALESLGLDPGNIPGSWEIHTGMTDQTPPLWGALSPDEMAQLHQSLFSAKGPIIVRFGDFELRYLPPITATKPRGNLRKLLTLAAGIIVKFKLVFAFLLVFVNLVVYGIAFGWTYGAALVILIGIHESGHIVANRIKKIPASLPFFIPFLGAFIQLKQSPQNAADEAFIGIMGPVFGLSATIGALALGIFTHHAFFLAAAEIGFLLHVFNLMPVLPLDGGRTVGFWQWKAWIPGMAGVLLVLFYNPLTNQFSFDPITIFIVAIIIISLRREPRTHNPAYVKAIGPYRWLYTGIWGLALAVSMAGYWIVGRSLPGL